MYPTGWILPLTEATEVNIYHKGTTDADFTKRVEHVLKQLEQLRDGTITKFTPETEIDDGLPF